MAYGTFLIPFPLAMRTIQFFDPVRPIGGSHVALRGTLAVNVLSEGHCPRKLMRAFTLRRWNWSARKESVPHLAHIQSIGEWSQCKEMMQMVATQVTPKRD